MGETVVVSRQLLTNIPGKADYTLKKAKEPLPVSRKIITDVWKCPGCSAEYTEQCLPRNLNCGHSVCSKCAEDFVDCQKSCFECLEKQSCKTVSDLPVNYPLLRFVNSHQVRDTFGEVETPPILNDNLHSSLRYKDTWKCGEHGNPIIYLCYICNAWICKDCLVLNHPPLPRGSCRTIEVENAMESVEKEYTKKADELLNDIESFRKTADAELGIHAFCLEHCSCDILKHEDVVQKTEKLLEEVKKSGETLVQDGKNKVEKLKSSLHEKTSPEEMTTLITETLAYVDQLKENIHKEKEAMAPVAKLMQYHLRMVIKLLVERKRIIYALQQNDKGTKWAPLTIQQEHLLLHSLRDGTPPDDGFIIPYEYARRLVPSDMTTIFLEVGTEEKSLGFVYFRLIHYMKFCDQFILMCSGEKGVSYRGTQFFRYNEEDCYLQGGDYQKNDGTGGSTIMHGLGDAFEQTYEYEPSAGTLIANEVSTRFNIRMPYKHEKEGKHGIMGHVQEGLNILQNLLKVRNEEQIIVKDSGLFIPMNVEEISDEEEDEKEEKGEEDEEEEEDEW